MSLTAVDRGEAAADSDDGNGTRLPTVVAIASLKALFAAAAGLVLTCGLGLLIWAITPSSGSGPIPLVRAGVTAFAAANGMTVSIGRSVLTLPPLMITVVAVALLTGVSGRGRVVAADRTQELVSTAAAAAVYAAAVLAAGVGLGSPGTVATSGWWRPCLLALVVVGVTALVRGGGWRRYLLDLLPGWVPVSVRLGAAATMAVIGGGAVTLLIGLIRSFGDATAVQTLAAPGAAGGFGMALLGVVYLPNAVVAGAGYATGVGFTVGAGHYSPFGSSPTELPAFSLLAAVPSSHAASRPAYLLLLVPVLAAVLIGRGAVRRLDLRSDRLLAAGGAAVVAAVLLASIAAVSSGGVTGGQWASSGVPPTLFGVVVAFSLGAIGAAVAGVARVPSAAVIGQRDDAEPDIAAPDLPTDDQQAADQQAGDQQPDFDAAPEQLLAEQLPAEHVPEEEVPEEEVPEEEVPEGEALEGEAREGEAPDEEVEVVAVDDAEPESATEVDEAPEGPPEQSPPPHDRRNQQRREEDLIGDADPETDQALIAGLARPPAPRQTG